jgi:hypothetical protein
MGKPERREAQGRFSYLRSPVSARRPLSPPDRALPGPEKILEEAAEVLPVGEAQPEAIAVRLRRAGVELQCGDPAPVQRNRVELLGPDQSLAPQNGVIERRAYLFVLGASR